jgi:hypothetical protein
MMHWLMIVVGTIPAKGIVVSIQNQSTRIFWDSSRFEIALNEPAKEKWRIMPRPFPSKPR